MFQPKRLKATVELARMCDEQLQRNRRYTPTNNRNFHSSQAPPPPPNANNNSTANEDQTSKPKRLIWEELKRKRSLGICFSCDERYTPGHKCQKSQLLLMVAAEDETDEDEETSETDEAEITLQALTGWDTPQTLRTPMKISGQNLVALIDSGSTHNFISEKVANRLNLQVSPTKEFNVRVADGHPLRCDGVYRAVTTVLSVGHVHKHPSFIR